MSKPRDVSTTDLIGARCGEFLRVESCVGTIDTRRHRGQGWRCLCACGGSIVLTRGEIADAQNRAVNTSCTDCMADRAAMRRGARAAYWDAQRDKDPRAELRLLWQDHHTLWSVRALARLAQDIRDDIHDVDLYRRAKYAYRGPCEIDVTDVWDPPDSQGDGCRVPGGMTLQAIADYFRDVEGTPLSRERIRQIEQKAMEKFAKGMFAAAPEFFRDGKMPDRSTIKSAAAALSKPLKRAPRTTQNATPETPPETDVTP